MVTKAIPKDKFDLFRELVGIKSLWEDRELPLGAWDWKERFLGSNPINELEINL